MKALLPFFRHFIFERVLVWCHLIISYVRSSWPSFKKHYTSNHVTVLGEFLNIIIYCMNYKKSKDCFLCFIAFLHCYSFPFAGITVFLSVHLVQFNFPFMLCRHYILDLMRVTPRDSNYIGQEHRFCVLRPELVSAFIEVSSSHRLFIYCATWFVLWKFLIII
jgi:hypothetical protein